MTAKVFLAGATGAIGSQLVPLLVEAGYRVFGSTRSRDKAPDLENAGAEPVVLDVFDAAAVDTAFSRVRPEILIHMLTDLPKDLNPEAMVEGKLRNARIWTEGTRNLIAAAKGAGTRRAIAQSLAWFYAPGPRPHGEDDPLGTADAGQQVVLEAVMALERMVLDSPPLRGTVLRYGLLYGPGTSSAVPQGACTLHVEAAAQAALLAIRKEAPGIFNIVDDNSEVSTERAKRDLGWSPDFRRVTPRA